MSDIISILIPCWVQNELSTRTRRDSAAAPPVDSLSWSWGKPPLHLSNWHAYWKGDGEVCWRPFSFLVRMLAISWFTRVLKPTKRRRLTENLLHNYVVYEYTCPKEDCKLLRNITYNGWTSSKLIRQLTSYLSSGWPKPKMKNFRLENLTRPMLTKDTKINSSL